MATFNVGSIGDNGASYWFTGLEFVWDTVQYFDAYCDLPGSVIFPDDPPGANHITQTGPITGLSSGTTYTANGFIVTASFATIFIGSVTFTTTGTPPLPPRPSNFNWIYTVVSSGAQNWMDHRDWNLFASSVNAFRAHVGLPAYGFTTAVEGVFPAFMYRQFVTAISEMGPAVPAYHFTGDDVNASDLEGLRLALNSIS